MKARLVRNGNSQAVRAAHAPRSGWEEAFRAMARQGDDVLLDADRLVPTRWDEKDWEFNLDPTVGGPARA